MRFFSDCTLSDFARHPGCGSMVGMNDRPGSAEAAHVGAPWGRGSVRDGNAPALLVLTLFLLLAGVTRGAAVGPRARAQAPEPGEAWTLVALPDTQVYAATPSLNAYFGAQTRWIAGSILGWPGIPEARNIAFVSHLGDIVNDGSRSAEWLVADTAMAVLDGDAAGFPQALVPYSAVIGNHDYAVVSDRQSSTFRYRQFFGASRYRDRSDGRSYVWYGDVSPDGLGHFQFFEAGGYRFLHLALPWEIAGSVDDPASALGWARRVIEAHPERATIISTHSYITDKPGAEGRTQQPQSEGGNSGEAIWRALVEPYPQVFMVLNGHWHETGNDDDGEFHQLSRNAAGLPVYEMLADYQDRENGGDGWLRLIDFFPGGGEDGGGGNGGVEAGAGGASYGAAGSAPDRIAVSTFSPTRDGGKGEYQRDARSEFGFDLDFETRLRGAFAGRPARPMPRLLLPYGSAWHYHDGLTPLTVDPRDPGFDPAAAGWPSGPALLGYGDDDLATTLDYGVDAANKPMTAWFARRLELDAASLADIDVVDLSLIRDDGAAVYINGREVARSNLPEGAGPETPATSSTADADERAGQVFRFKAADVLRAGSNLLAVEVHQISPSSSDLAFDFSLSGEPRDRGRAAPDARGLWIDFEREQLGDMASLRDAEASRLRWWADYLSPPRSASLAGVTDRYIDPQRPLNRHQMVLRQIALRLASERVDLRGMADPRVALDLRTWEDSALTDFEPEDLIRLVARSSADGLAFDERVLLELRGDTNAGGADPLKRLDRGRDGAFTRYESAAGDLPPGARMLELVLEAVNDSDSEHFFFDNLRVYDAAAPTLTPAPGATAVAGVTAAASPSSPASLTAGPPTASPTAAPPLPTFDPETVERIYLPWLPRP
jgi:hypothetical protein